MEFTKELTDKILASDFIQCNNLDDAFVIMYNDKIFAPKQGRMFHATYQDAWKHFYNQMHWRVGNYVKNDFAKSLGFDNWWKCNITYPKSNRQIWEEFKKVVFDNGFRIIRWKDAKRDVCSES